MALAPRLVEPVARPETDLPPRVAHRLLAAMALAWLAVMAAAAAARHANVRTHLFDLGIHDQALFLISRGLHPYLNARGLDLMADHLSPVAWLLAPVYWLWDSPVALLVLQSAALALGAVAAYGLARACGCGRRAGLAFAALYLVQPSLLFLNRFDFHFSALATPALLFALWGLEAGRPGMYAAGILATLTTGEAAGFPVLFLAWNAGRRRGRWWALGSALAGAGALVAAVVASRALNLGEPTQYLALYAAWGPDGASILKALATDPLGVAAAVATERNLGYLACLLVPLALLPLLGAEALVPAVPTLLGNLLSWRDSQQSVSAHYTATLLPFLLWAAILGFQRLPRPRPWLLLAALAATAGVSSWLMGPLSPFQRQAFVMSRSPAMGRAAAAVPEDASVAAANDPGGRLAHRVEAWLLPNPFQALGWGNRPQAVAEQSTRGHMPLEPGALRRSIEAVRVDSVVMDLDSGFPQPSADHFHLYQGLAASGRYGVVLADDDALVLRRGAPPRPEVRADFFRSR